MNFSLLLKCILLIAFINHAQAENINSLKLKAAVCEQCHNIDKNTTNLSLPQLAGQNKAYLIQQINIFLKGHRKHPILKPANKKISPTQIELLAKHYSKLEIKTTDIDPIYNSETGIFSHPNRQLIQRGESIYSPCAGCHGMEAEGITPYPRLAGQQSNYLKHQLTQFKTGKRNNKIMQIMTANLSDEDINALAIYLSSLNKINFQTGNVAQK